ncbi:hypothetical protein [Geminocystis herdmanii]|uniref:hypothetical protein n=1 Tax=Geminocystis herdmanii TaxID=669359 RepID=UPI0003455FFA|nr:hypothetical protein [Geminocystis herdmanii]
MSIKELIKQELDYLSEEDLQEFYQVIKSRSQREVNNKNNNDELGDLLEKCQVSTGITDLAEQHDHYLYGTPKRGN